VSITPKAIQDLLDELEASKGDIWIHDLWFRVESIDDPPSEATIPLLVP
jgi:hypothetical protein